MSDVAEHIITIQAKITQNEVWVRTLYLKQLIFEMPLRMGMWVTYMGHPIFESYYISFIFPTIRYLIYVHSFLEG